ncbi:MAG: PfkB family carbohydrate kinase, partial [Syntrophales bacterium]|nr:PfkB family carbohydrate kinase [Syntrophales bacterium]
MSTGVPQVFGLGQCSLDHIGKIDVYPPPDVKCELFETVIQGGGPAATAMAALARWGLSCYIAGVIGDDLFGRLIETSLRDEGVNTAGLVIRKGATSQFAFIAAEPVLGRRTVFWQRPTGQEIQPDEIDLTMLRKARVLHTDGLCTETALFAAGKARQSGVSVVVDAGTLRDGMVELARLSDCFIASEPFARALTGDQDPRRACRILSDLGPRVVGVTLGEAGYVAMDAGKWIEKPAYMVRAIDTTGCGDVFHAGFVYGLVHGWNAEKSLDLGAWAAAQVSLELGGRSGIPTLDALRKKSGNCP